MMAQLEQFEGIFGIMEENEVEDEEDVKEVIKFESIEEMTQTLKGLSYEEVIELAKMIGVTWKEHPHTGINRMRASMAIREHFFPGQRRPKKPQPWRKFPYERLVEIAQQYGIKWRRSKNRKIDRMWLTKALKDAGIQPPTE